MGLTKRLLEDLDAIRGEAMGVLLRSKVLGQCDYHDGYYFEGRAEIADAYKLANYLVTKGEIEIPGGYSRAEFSEFIKEVFDDNSYATGCTYCEKIRLDD